MDVHIPQSVRQGGQPDLFETVIPAPDGFRYRPDSISPTEEAALVNVLETLDFEPFDFHGHLAHRHVVGFGFRYDYASRSVRAAAPFPDFLAPLRERVAAFAGRPPQAFEQVLINRYRPGAGIGWHKDKPQFDEVGVSLLAPCIFRFRMKAGERWKRLPVPVAPRSAYLLTDPARQTWEHSIATHEQLRYSITLRTLAPDQPQAVSRLEALCSTFPGDRKPWICRRL